VSYTVGATNSPQTFSAPLSDVDIAVKAAPGNLLSITASNINAAIRYLQIFNQTTAPVNPNVPVISIPMGAGSATAVTVVTLDQGFFGEGGLYLSAGIAIGLSTTAATFTAATTTDHSVNGCYV
jgi:hypothetical protein